MIVGLRKINWMPEMHRQLLNSSFFILRLQIIHNHFPPRRAKKKNMLQHGTIKLMKHG